ncbi:MAG: GNAT family N-acetyltransferase [Actinomycetota bacterium]|nr:GNAT family N-acetyltransferase [Actinomycetota bacterium]
MPELTVPTELGDGVVTLRGWRADDVPWLVEACQDPEIPRWTVVPSPYSEADARAFVAMQSDRRSAGEAAPFAIASGDDDSPLGSIEITMHDWRSGRGEVGYWIAAPARRRGVAMRALALVVRWGFETLDLGRLELLAEPENEASQRLAERAGFTREGVLRSYRVMKGRRVDFVVFSLLPSDPQPVVE